METPINKLKTDFPEFSTTETGKSFQQVMGIKEPFLRQTGQARQDVVEEEGKVLQAQQRQKELEAAGKTRTAMQYTQDVSGAQQTYQEAKAAEPTPAFVPTKDSAQDLAKLFSFIGVMGTFLGTGGGKQAAMGAMSAMTGMMEGWRQGRADLYNQEKTKFDKDFARVNKIHQDLAKDLEIAIRTASTDKELGIRLAEEAAVRAGSDIVKAQIKKGNLVGAYETSKEFSAAADKAIAEVNKRESEDRRNKALIQAAEARASVVKPTRPDIWIMPDGTFIDASKQPDGLPPKGARRPTAVEAENRATEREAARERKAEDLSPVERKELRGLQNLSSEIQLLAETFKPEYANFVFDKAGDITAKYQARVAKDPAMADWWRRYENVALPERHSMFGATLTGGERDSWRKSSIGAGNSTEEILSWIADKERVMGRKVDLLLQAPPTKGQPKPAAPAKGGSASPGTGQRRVVSDAEVQAYAAKYNLTPQEARQTLTKLGYQ